jgi:hypothetical protein
MNVGGVLDCLLPVGFPVLSAGGVSAQEDTPVLQYFLEVFDPS